MKTDLIKLQLVLVMHNIMHTYPSMKHENNKFNLNQKRNGLCKNAAT